MQRVWSRLGEHRSREEKSKQSREWRRMLGDQSREEKCKESRESQKRAREEQSEADLDSAAVSVFVVILVELTNTVFVNSTNI